MRGGPIAVVLVLALASPAAAHLALTYPTSRYGDTVLKIGPCGKAGGKRSEHVTTLDSGASIEVVWDEYVDHPGHFRIAFDADGDDDFVDPACLAGCTSRSPTIESYSNTAVLLDHIADTPFGGDGSAMITLPDIECDNCTLQVIQVMYDKPPYTLGGDDIYYQCADLVLHRREVPTSSPSPSPTQTLTRSPTRPIPTATPTRTRTPTSAPCIGDCANAGNVTVPDLSDGVAIALAPETHAPCVASFDRNLDEMVTIEELVAAAVSHLVGCL